MTRLITLYIGAIAVAVASYAGLVAAPAAQLDLGPESAESADAERDRDALFGLAAQGRDVYISLGCMYCHSQQVRPRGFGADIDRGWGERRTVATDYAEPAAPVLGTMRTGPDLASVATRQPSRDWHLLHLYDPRLTSPGSTMPRFAFLFEVRTFVNGRPYNAIDTPPGVLEPGQYLVPTTRAEALAAYLRTLDKGSRR